MRKASYLRKLAAGNIGAALGVTSGGLISIDIDDENAVPGFLALNPGLLRTFQTKGRRGRNFWMRMLGRYPGSAFLKLNGQPWGEFRSHGLQTIVWGTHPEGMRYQWLNRHPALTATYQSITWPDGLSIIDRESKELHRETDEADEADEVSVGVCVSPEHVFTPEEVVLRCVPQQRGGNHRLLHELNRGIRALEIQEGRTFDLSRRRAFFNLWYQQSLATGFLRPGQTRDEYFLEFMGSANVKVPLGSGELLNKALAKAKSEPEPHEAEQFPDSPDIRLLVALCYQLQLMAGDQPFFLSARKASEALGASWKSCATWMKGLCRLGVLQLVTKGGLTEVNGVQTYRREASRYKYVSLCVAK